MATPDVSRPGYAVPGPPSGRGFGTPAVKSVYLNPFSTESVQGRHRRHLLPHLSCRFGNECQTTYIMMIPAPRKVSARRRQHGQRSSRRATHLPRIGAGKQKTTPRKKKPRTRGSSHGEITSAAKIQSRANTRENSHQLLRLGIQASCTFPHETSRLPHRRVLPVADNRAAASRDRGFQPRTRVDQM